MKTWAWVAALGLAVAAGGAIWVLWQRATAFCSLDDAGAVYCAVAVADAEIWSWVAVCLAAVGSAVALTLGRESAASPLGPKPPK